MSTDAGFVAAFFSFCHTEREIQKGESEEDEKGLKNVLETGENGKWKKEKKPSQRCRNLSFCQEVVKKC